VHVLALQAGEAVRKAAVAAVRSDLGEQQQQAQGHQRRDPQQHTASRETHRSVGDFANRPAGSLPTERTAALLSGIDHLAVTAAELLLPAAPRASGISAFEKIKPLHAGKSSECPAAAPQFFHNHVKSYAMFYYEAPASL
jgi:hypothetical protein